LNSAKKNKPESGHDAPEQNQPSRPVPVGGKTDDGRGNPAFNTPQRGRKRCCRIAPAEFIDDGVKKRGEAVKEGAGSPEMNDTRGQNDPPAVKDFFHDRVA